MKRPKSPQLKVPEVKVPPVLNDLYWDLRDRRLLPLVGLLLVAIVAAPLLLNGGKSPEPARVPPGGSGVQRPASLAVLPAEPGLREPSKRLAGRRSKNPFKQHYAAPLLKPGAKPVSGSKLATTTTTTTTGGEASTSGGETQTTGETLDSAGSSESATSAAPSGPPNKASTGKSPSVTPADGSGGSEGSGGSGGSHDSGRSGDSNGPGGGDKNHAVPPSGLTYYTFAIDVQITQASTKPDGSTETSEPTVHKEVEPPQALPGEKAPVVTYIGASAKTQNPLFLISTEVTGVFGEGKCVAGTTTCQLIELEPGFPVTFIYGENHVRYKLNVIKVLPVITGHS